MEEKILEQPAFDTDGNSQISSDMVEQMQSENQSGSSLGKFKDAQSLLDAYNALQGEFTRKSQKLAEFQRKCEENALFQIQSEELETVLNDCEDSEKYKKEIEELLSTNEKLGRLPNKYRVAFETINETKNRLKSILKSPEFYDEYIAKNDEIKTKIIDEYLSKLNNVSTAPKLMTGNSTSVYFTPQAKPKSVREAGEIFAKMLK